MVTPRRWRRYAAPALAIFAVLVAVLLGAITQRQKDKDVRDLPPGARAQIFQQSLTEVRSTCIEAYAQRGPLREHCIDQARFLMLFPECGSECRTAANVVLPHAHR